MSFKSWRSYIDFSYSIKNNLRYIFDQESQDFLKGIKDTCVNRLEIIPINSLMWRAQTGCDYEAFYQGEAHIDDFPIPYLEKRMRPLVNGASEGRANSKGIPCLYVASNQDTAMSEVRPWLGSILSVAKFISKRDLRIINLFKHHGKINPFYLKEPDREEKIESVWRYIDNAFSEPVTNSDLKSDYAPTQIIAELIKSLGYDGIAFKSSLGDGHNLALFDLNCVEFKASEIYEAHKIDFSFSKLSNPYDLP